jgi:hypothetical protein
MISKTKVKLMINDYVPKRNIKISSIGKVLNIGQNLQEKLGQLRIAA